MPDISKWDTSNIVRMNALFYNCSSLISIPDISKWDISQVEEMDDMFGECFELLVIPSKYIK